MPYPPNRVAGDYDSLHGAGRSRARTGLRWCHLSSVAVIVALLGAPVTIAVASPPAAVDQYTQHLPTAGGGSPAGSGAGASAPVARLGLLPPKTQRALSGPDGRLLAQIATARTLGAPSGVKSGHLGSSGRGFVSASASAVGGAPALALVGALAAILVAGAWNRRRASSNRLG
jgi:hypothetical protein